MSTAQAKAVPVPSTARRLLPRLVLVAVAAVVFTWGVSRLARRTADVTRVAGFAQGMLHGAMMPLALPQLLAGRDVAIYAANNTGRTYKLGYTIGVNGCGALFFGIFYWRVNRWRKSRQAGAAEPTP